MATTKFLSDISIDGDLSVTGNELNLPSGGQLDWANGDARIVEGLVSNYSLSFQTYTGSSLTTKMFIQSGGNVGIGTTDPTTTLDVRGDVMVESENTPTLSVRDTTNNLVGRLRAANSYVYLTADHGDTVGSSRIVFQVDGNSSAYVTNGLFSVDGNIQILDTDTADGGEFGYLNFHSTSGGSTGNHARISAVRDSNAAGQILFHTKTGGGSTEKMRITSGGNVGIGTTSPGSKLHISGATDESIIRLQNTATSLSLGDTIGALQFYNSDTTDDSPNIAASIYATAGPSGGSGYLSFRTTEAGTEGAAATATMTLTNGGNVGIGTASPTGKLMVREDSAGNPTRLIVSNGGTVQSGTTARLSFYEGTSEKGYIERRRDGSGKIAFVTPADDNPFVWENLSGEIMRITNSNVGIGTTSPSEKLEIYGNATYYSAKNTSGNVAVRLGTDGSGDGNFELFQSADANNRKIKLYAETNAANYINNGGNFGIGTTSPSEKLDVVGNIELGDGGSGASLKYNSTNRGTILVNGSEIMRLEAAGNVGIGTTVPYSLLQVGNPEQTTPAELTIASRYDGGGPILNFRTDHPSNDNQWNMARIQATDDGNYNGRLEFKTTVNSGNSGTQPQTRMVIKATGNVGIGTTSPREKLDVDGDIVTTWGNDKFVGLQYQQGAAYQNGLLLHGDNRSTGLIAKGGTGSTPYIWFGVSEGGNTERMRITKDGNIGIGTNSPTNGKLVIDSTANQIAIETGTAGDGRLNIGHFSNGTFIGTYGDDGGAADIIRFGTHSGDERMRIASAGNVGIGNTAPAQRLHVAGNQVRLDTAAGGYYLHNASGTFRGAFHDNGTTTNIFGDGNGSTPALSIESNNVTFAGAVTIEGGTLELGEADTASGHINAKELMTFNIDTDNDDTNRYFAWYKDGSSGSGTELLKILESGNATFAADVTVGGNLIVNGTTTTLNTTTVEVEDNILQLNTTQGTPDTATAATSGISVYRGNGVTQASLIFDDGDDTWDLTNNLAVAGSIKAIGAIEVKDSDESTTLSHVRAMSNATEGWLSLSNGSNWGLIARGVANEPRLGAYHGGVLKIEGFHSATGDPGSNAIDFAQFQFGNNHFQMNAATSTFAGNVTLSSTAPILYLANTTSSTGKTWRFSSAANGNAYITQDGVIDAITLSHTSGNATFAGVVNISNIINTTGSGAILRKTASSWTNRENQDILYQGWNINTGDYIYLKAPGNSSVDHATAFIGDDVFSFGRSDVETGAPELTSAAAPLSENWLVLNSTSATFAGGITTGGDINVPEYVVHDGDTNTHIRFTADRIRLVAGGTVKFDSNSPYITGLDWTEISGDAANINVSGFNNDAGYLTALPSHNHDDRYYTETEIDAKFTSSNGTEDEFKFTLGDESNLSGNKWYKVAHVNTGNGGLHIKGSLSNHVESFGSQKVDLLLQGREGNDGDEIEITGTVDVLHNATGTGTDKAGVRVIKSAVGTNYDTYTIYIRTTRYSLAKFHLTKFGTTAFYTSKPSVTSEPAPVSGGNVELDTSTLQEGNYVIDNSTPREIYHEGHKPTYTELGTMAYSNLTGTPTLGTAAATASTDFVSATGSDTMNGTLTINTTAVPFNLIEDGHTGTGKYWRIPLDGGSIRFDVDTTNTNGNGTFTSYTAVLSLKANGDVQLRNYGAGILKTDANGNISLDTSTYLTSINNGNWSGTDLSVANGGTGASSASAARTNLGLGSAATSNTSAFAAASHTHAASDITSGTFDSARLPSPVSGDWWNNGVVKVLTDGVMEVGKYMDWHDSDTETSDYSYRMTASNTNMAFSGTISASGGSFSSNVGMATGHSSGKFAVMSTAVHGSFDFYNNGTSYLNGAATVDAAFTQSGGAASTFSGNVGIGTTSPNTITSSVATLSLGGTHATVSGGVSYQVNGSVKFYQYVDADALFVHQGQSGIGQKFKVNGSEAMRITSGGNVGIGTTSPSEKLEVAGNIKIGDSNIMYLGAGNDLQIYHDGTNSVINNTTGNLQIYNNANDGDIQFISDDGSGGVTDYIVIDGSTTENVFYKNAALRDSVKATFGNSNDLQIYHDASNSYIVDTGTGDLNIQADNNINIKKAGGGETKAVFTSDGAVELYYDNSKKFETTSAGVTITGAITATGDITAFSDARVKENIETIDNALHKVTQLRGVEYNKIGSEEKSIGVVAQEIREVLPEVVKENEDGMLSVAYGNITGVLIEAIKEQQKQIEELKAQLDGFTK